MEARRAVVYTLLALGGLLLLATAYHGTIWLVAHGWGTAVAMAWVLLAILAAVLIRQEVVRRRRNQARLQ